MGNGNYVQMPQDDLAQLEQVVQDYEAEPAKGLAHGLQKDAIQNGFGARLKENEKAACRDWKFKFELLKIKGADAVVFWDEGTRGLTGEILSADEIQTRIGERRESTDSLGPEQRLSRFLARFVSGGNFGPGTFGRGKLIFHGASQNYGILVDSLRHDDGIYIALDRRVRGGKLVQPRVPHQDKKAKEFMKKETGGVLRPLKKPGTRITVLRAKPEIVQAIKNSFSSNRSTYCESLAYMVEETWWETIHRFGACITIKHGNKSMQVKLTEPLTTIVTTKDKTGGMRVHKAELVPVAVGGQTYRIKEVRLVLFPDRVDPEFNEVWLQRKRMKIGKISKNIHYHHNVTYRISGYVVLDPGLEKLVEKAEGLTHYALSFAKASVVWKIRDAVRKEVEVFQHTLGLAETTDDAKARRRLLDSMKDLNDLASELGLVTQDAAGIKKTTVDIGVDELNLPDKGTLRVEIGDTVGPIKYKVISNVARSLTGVFDVYTKQTGHEVRKLHTLSCAIEPKESCDVEIPSFEITKGEYENGKALDIIAEYSEESSGRRLARCSRRLYIGTEAPTPDKSPVRLRLNCKFPRRDTHRVEKSEVIRDIRIKLTNTTPHNLKLDVELTVRHIENRTAGRPTTPLFSLLKIEGLKLKPQADYSAAVGDITITPDKFGSIFELPASVSDRTCDIHAVVKLSEASKELNLPRKYKLNKASTKFYIEVDPPGHSIFHDAEEQNAEEDGRQSWYVDLGEPGYKFVLNIGHNSYKFIESRGDAELIKSYYQEQILRQAYLVAFANEFYAGPAEKHKEALMDSDLTAKDAAQIFEEIVGTALKQVRS